MSKPLRLSPWVLAALACVLLLLLLKPDDAHVVLSKTTMYIVGNILGFLGHHTLMPYQRPSGYLVEPWHLSMLFKDGAADHRVVAGCEWLFLGACVTRALCMQAGGFIVGLGM